MFRSAFRISLPLLLAFSGEIRANGYYILTQAPEATGRGNAWLATADTAAAVYYNAAGLTQLDEQEFSLGIYSIRLGIDADTASGSYTNDASWALIPQIYAAIPVSEDTVLGVGINTPFGLSTEWPDQTQFRQLAITSELQYLTGWLVAGHKLSETFSIGGGVGLHVADALLSQGIGGLGSSDRLQFEGGSEALTWTLSARWEPNAHHAVGMVYRSKADFNLKGDTRIFAGGGAFKEDASLDFIAPATAALGYAYSPSAKWVMEANIEWVNWDELDDLTLSNSVRTSIPFRWESNFIYSAGATRFFENGWNASAGYNYIENSQPDANFSPGIPDADRHWINLGVGRKYETMEWSFAAQYGFSNRTVNGSPGGLGDGKYKSRFTGVMLNCRWTL